MPVPIVRQYGKGKWRVYQVTHVLHGALHYIGYIEAVKITKPKTTVYDAYTIKGAKIGRKFQLKDAVKLLDSKEK